MIKRTLGIDIGNVIRPEGELFLNKDYLDILPIDGAFEAIGGLVEMFGPAEVFLVSSCLNEVERRTMKWFKHLRFFKQTGVRWSHARFCRGRFQKAPICEELRISHFIDDRIGVLRMLTTVDHLYLFSPDKDSTQNFDHGLGNVTVLQSWADSKVIEF